MCSYNAATPPDTQPHKGRPCSSQSLTMFHTFLSRDKPQLSTYRNSLSGGNSFSVCHSWSAFQIFMLRHKSRLCARQNLCTNFPTMPNRTRTALFTPLLGRVLPVVHCASAAVPAPPEFDISDEEIQNEIAKLTPRERVRTMYRKTGTGEFSDEVSHIGMFLGLVALMVIPPAAVIASLREGEHFKERNKHTKYNTKYRAMMHYRDAAMKGAIRVSAWVLLMNVSFLGIWLFTSETLALYRLKTDMWNYIPAGVITCGVLRSHLGLRGIVAGSVIGLPYGLVGGGVCLLFQYMNNLTMEERYAAKMKEVIYQRKLVATQMGKSPDELQEPEPEKKRADRSFFNPWDALAARKEKRFDEDMSMKDAFSQHVKDFWGGGDE